MSKSINSAAAKYYNGNMRRKQKLKERISLIGACTPVPSPADMLPSWKEAVPTSDKMDDAGTRALAAAIIAKTAEDYWHVCDHPYTEVKTRKFTDVEDADSTNALCCRRMIEMFIDESTLFDALTDIDRKLFKETIKKMKAQGKKIPRMVDIDKPVRESKCETFDPYSVDLI